MVLSMGENEKIEKAIAKKVAEELEKRTAPSSNMTSGIRSVAPKLGDVSWVPAMKDKKEFRTWELLFLAGANVYLVAERLAVSQQFLKLERRNGEKLKDALARLKMFLIVECARVGYVPDEEAKKLGVFKMAGEKAGQILMQASIKSTHPNGPSYDELLREAESLADLEELLGHSSEVPSTHVRAEFSAQAVSKHRKDKHYGKAADAEAEGDRYEGRGERDVRDRPVRIFGFLNRRREGSDRLRARRGVRTEEEPREPATTSRGWRRAQGHRREARACTTTSGRRWTPSTRSSTTRARKNEKVVDVAKRWTARRGRAKKARGRRPRREDVREGQHRRAGELGQAQRVRRQLRPPEEAEAAADAMGGGVEAEGR
eukprot:GDKH01028883.1.p1 GENE.GDKH01028883.1~~GDKH01028883.1.p1  ORF type:complete len:373 (-),score=66.00 GDKH01028883.1:649-1767(-)